MILRKEKIKAVVLRLKKALETIEYIAARDPEGALALAESHSADYQLLLHVLDVDEHGIISTHKLPYAAWSDVYSAT